MIRTAKVPALLLLTVLARAAGAQTETTLLSAADSAAEARRAWNAAVEASRANDLAAARQALDRAARAWPTQPLYSWTRAVLAARASDSAALRDALRDYARLGLGGDLGGTTAFAPFSALPWFQELAVEHLRHRAPLERSRVRLTLADSTLFPESVAHDPRSGDLFVSSVRHRTVVRIDAGRSERDLWPRGRADFGAVLGIRVSPDGEYLWATMAGIPQMAGYRPGDSTLAAIVKVRLPDGVVVERWDLDDGLPHVLGDVAIGSGGEVFVPDSRQPVLYRLRPGADSLEALRHPLFRSLQGIAPDPDGDAVFVADYSHGILRVELGSGSVTRLRDADNSTSVGIDGLLWHHGALIGIQNGVSPPRVVRFTLNPAGDAIVRAETIDRHVPLADEPTNGVIVGDTLVYVANSPWAHYGEDGERRPGTTLPRPVLLALPLLR